MHLNWAEEWLATSIKLINNSGNMFFLTKKRKCHKYIDGGEEEYEEWSIIKKADLQECLNVGCKILNPYYHKRIAIEIESNGNKDDKSLELVKQKLAFTCLGLRPGHFVAERVFTRKMNSYDYFDFFPYLKRKVEENL